MRLTLPIMIRRVQGHSMLPVLPPGTLVFGWRWFMRLRQEQVVIFERQNREIVKRIDAIGPEGVFMLGDHPEASTDSRQYGVVPRKSVQAVVFWPRTRKVIAQSGKLPIRRRDSVA